jgi:hypothetical protein
LQRIGFDIRVDKQRERLHRPAGRKGGSKKGFQTSAGFKGKEESKKHA